jgi:hypothetical protein
MNTQQFWKGLLMTLVALFVSMWTTTINWVLLGINVVSTILTYFGKNLIPWLHSDSPAGQLSLINIISGICIALGTGLLNGLGQYFLTDHIVWASLGKLVLSVTFTYLGGTIFQGSYNNKTLTFK